MRLAVRDKVETPRGFGEIKETADTIALVQLGDEEKVFYLTDLKPVSELEYVMKSLDNLGIELEEKRTQNTELAKSFFERIEKSLGDEEEIKKLKTSFYKKEAPKAPVPQTLSAVKPPIKSGVVETPELPAAPSSTGGTEVNRVKISPNKPPVVSTSIIPPGSKPPVAPTGTKAPVPQTPSAVTTPKSTGGTEVNRVKISPNKPPVVSTSIIPPGSKPPVAPTVTKEPTGTISINKPQKTEPINKPEASPYRLKPFQVTKTGNSDIKDFDKEAFDMTKNVPDKPVSKPGALRKIWNNLKGSGSEDVKKKPVNNNVLDLDTGKVSRLDQSREVPSTAHTLTHISLNQNARSDDEKLNYHYKIGNKANAKVSTYPLDAKGKPTFDKHPAMQGKTFLPGEKIKHQGKPYTVHSHINPMPDANGQVDYNKMLIQDENGNKFSVNRANVEHIGTDFSTAKQVQLEDGTKKYHHQLKDGDKIVHKGTAHEVVGPGDNGYLTESDKGELHYTFAFDYDKNFKHNEYDRNKKAVKDDIVEFEYLGTKKQRRVTNDHPDGAIVQINKSDDPILVPHGQYSFTGKRGFMEHPDLKDKKKGKEIDTSQGPMPAESISEKMAASDEFKTGNTLDKFTGADKKSHRKQQIDDNHFVHSLGMKGEDGEVKIHSDKNGSISHIENPFIKIHGERHKILGVSPEKGTITMVSYKKGKTPAINEKTGRHKGQETYNLTDLRESQNMQPIIKENVQKTGEENLKGVLLSNVAKAHKDSGVTDPNDIGNETNATANNHIALSKKLLEGDEAILKKHQDNKNKITRGDNLFERDDYEPSSLDKNRKYTDILKEELGDDWKNQVSGKVKELNEAEAGEKHQKAIKQAQQKITQENKAKETQGERDYLEKTYSKLPSYKEKSITEQLGIRSKSHHKIATPDPELGDIRAEAHLFHLDDLIPSHLPTEIHLKRNENGIPNLEKVPFKRHANSAGHMIQARQGQYEDLSGTGDQARKFTIEDVANKYDPARGHNDIADGDRGRKVIGDKMEVYGGNGGTMAEHMLSPGQVKEKHKYILDNLDRDFQMPDGSPLTPEKKNEIKKVIEESESKGEQITSARVALHPKIGEAVSLEYHTDYGKRLGKVLNDPSNKPITEEEEKKGLLNSINDEHRKQLMGILPRDKSYDKAKEENGLKILKKGEGLKLLNANRRAELYDDQTNKLTDKGHRFLDAIYKHSYFDKGLNDKLAKLPKDDQEPIHNFRDNHINELLALKSNNPNYDLKPELEQIIADKIGEKKNLKGQGSITGSDFDITPAAKGLRHIMSLPLNAVGKGETEKPGQKDILKRYTTAIENLKKTEDGGGIFSEQQNIEGAKKKMSEEELLKSEKEKVQKIKNDFFGKYAKEGEIAENIKSRKLKKSFFRIGQYKLEYPEKPKIILLKAK